MPNANQVIGHNIENILDNLGIEYKDNRNRYSLACPIHGGSNKKGAVIYKNDEYPNFQCFTRNCHISIGNSLFSFLGYILKLNKTDLTKWVEDRYGKTEEIKFDSFCRNTACLTKKVTYLHKSIPINELKSKLISGPTYYINRGFSKEILEKYLVGVYSMNTDRVTIPVLDIDKLNCIGYSSRSLHKKCCLCDQYHDYNKICVIDSPKWKHSYNFNRNSTFYNISRGPIKTLFLVEGPADVWRMVEAGFNNTWAVFGTGLTEDQKLILESSNIENIVTFFDPDKAGISGAEIIKKYCENLFNYYNIEYHLEPSDCTEKEINKLCGLYC